VPLVGQERRQQPVFLAAFLVRNVQPAAQVVALAPDLLQLAS
jgi:hypothetical protein